MAWVARPSWRLVGCPWPAARLALPWRDFAGGHGRFLKHCPHPAERHFAAGSLLGGLLGLLRALIHRLPLFRQALGLCMRASESWSTCAARRAIAGSFRLLCWPQDAPAPVADLQAALDCPAVDLVRLAAGPAALGLSFFSLRLALLPLAAGPCAWASSWPDLRQLLGRPQPVPVLLLSAECWQLALWAICAAVFCCICCRGLLQILRFLRELRFLVSASSCCWPASLAAAIVRQRVLLFGQFLRFRSQVLGLIWPHSSKLPAGPDCSAGPSARRILPPGRQLDSAGPAIRFCAVCWA